eukprot:1881926-Rhodomonas_salina.3
MSVPQNARIRCRSMRYAQFSTGYCAWYCAMEYVQAEVNCKKPSLQYNWYQQCGFLRLIPVCTGIGGSGCSRQHLLRALQPLVAAYPISSVHRVLRAWAGSGVFVPGRSTVGSYRYNSFYTAAHPQRLQLLGVLELPSTDRDSPQLILARSLPCVALAVCGQWYKPGSTICYLSTGRQCRTWPRKRVGNYLVQEHLLPAHRVRAPGSITTQVNTAHYESTGRYGTHLALA